MVNDVMKDLQGSIEKAIDAFRRDLTKVRTGRANVAILDGSAPGAMLLIAPEGRIVFANQQAEKLLGYDMLTLCTMQVEA
jgi:PAS domain-containing protein